MRIGNAMVKEKLCSGGGMYLEPCKTCAHNISNKRDFKGLKWEKNPERFIKIDSHVCTLFNSDFRQYEPVKSLEVH